MGVEQRDDVMIAHRDENNRTTDPARRAAMGKAADTAARTIVSDFRRYYLRYNEGDSD